ncbi:hypothetical protein LTR97_008359 [Elasticomyces elasticus]|uniref:chitinase n=1 Tax=Elasticomyces elasticus TaxID=574655 RepID=A0AAN7W720_9PEZI|nr:hypothetical protein LTR97_008359 [Elasticomyces elasticus]
MLPNAIMCAILLNGLVPYTRARHVHHKPLHKHVHRAEPPSPTFTSTIAGEAQPSDLQAFQGQVDDLTKYILSSIADIERRLRDLEKVLASLQGTPLTSSTTTDQALPSLDSTPVTSAYAQSTVSASVTTTTTPALPIATSYGNRTAYTFHPDAKDNVAVYYGQSAKTTAGGLAALCRNQNVDIVVLAFVNDFFSVNGYPTINFGPACDPPTDDQKATAPGLLHCPRLASQIKVCQHLGKPVLVSLGGYIANTSFTSNAQAKEFAGTLWNLFGAGNETTAIRPFGPDVVVDGFDIDNENHNTTFYNTFATALRTHMSQDKSKRYYITAAPQCPIPDESIPLQLMRQADFVWVQFYNNPSCNLNSTGFEASFKAWSKLLANGAGKHKPRLYIGGGAADPAGSGYVAGQELRRHTNLVKNLRVKNLGGMMLWDGSMGIQNVDKHGHGYLHYAKAAVQLKQSPFATTLPTSIRPRVSCDKLPTRPSNDMLRYIV